MKIKCNKCQAVFNVDEKLVKKSGSKAKCLKCSNILIIYPPEKPENASPEPGKISPEVKPQVKSEVKPQVKKKKNECSTLQLPPVFRTIGINNCPLYELGDEFQLAGSIFTVPPKKAPCLILAKDVTNIIKSAGNLKIPNQIGRQGQIFRCSGCKGVIRFVKKPKTECSGMEIDSPDDDYIEVVTKGLGKFPIFQALDDNVIREFTGCLKFDEFAAGELIIKKGDPGKNLYIIVSGKVEVMGDDEMRIAMMSSGEIFGEMSLLSGNTVGATIKAMEPTTVLYISGQNLKTILSNSPSLQMYFTRLLAGRMAEINLARSIEFASGITGKISEMAPSELFQMFNMNQKTGILSLQSNYISASISFRDGEIIRVDYGDKEGREAFFDLLKLKRGRFKFNPGLSMEEMESKGMGDFMQLLMEGLRRIDEDDKRFLRTVVPTLIDEEN